jgi:hypothetical protein
MLTPTTPLDVDVQQNLEISIQLISTTLEFGWNPHDSMFIMIKICLLHSCKR